MIGFSEDNARSILTVTQTFPLYVCLLAWPLMTRAFHHSLISSTFFVGVKNKANTEIKHPFHKIHISKKRNWWSFAAH